jgi:flagellar motility protein MotE (MotC chaperone)
MAKKKSKKDGKAKKPLNKFKVTILALLTAFILIAGSFLGTYFFIVGNNYQGVATKYEEQLKNIPVLNLALPKRDDPEDEKLLTEDQVRSKYTALLKKRNELNNTINNLTKENKELKKTIEELKKTNAQDESYKKESESKIKSYEDNKKSVDDLKASVDALIAKGDTAGFKQYFEKVNPQTAKDLYSQIVKQDTANENAKKFAATYEKMESATAAKLFESLSKTNMDLAVNILSNMKKESYMAVLAQMDSTLAATFTEKMSKDYFKK